MLYDRIDKNDTSLNRLSLELLKLINARVPLVHIQSNELARLIETTRTILLHDDPKRKYYEWSSSDGLNLVDLNRLELDNKQETVLDPKQAGLRFILKTFYAECFADVKVELKGYDREAQNVLVLINPEFPQLAELEAMFHVFHNNLPATSFQIVVLSTNSVKQEYSKLFYSLRLQAPTKFELHERFKDLFDSMIEGFSINKKSVAKKLQDFSLTENQQENLFNFAKGLPLTDFETTVSLTVLKSLDTVGEVRYDDLLSGVMKGKTEIVNRNDVLELYPQDSLDSIAGLNVYKKWIRTRKFCFTPQAQELGIEWPKGVVTVGVQGTGKSLGAKAAAGELNVPLVRLDIGKVFNSLVGKTEERIRDALNTVEDIAPCVLFIDEVDKALGGSGDGDSGTTKRMLSTLLTWMNDHKSPVFSILTANNIQALPPELTRRGRFDAIFCTLLPGKKSREDAINIHLKKRGCTPLVGEDLHTLGAVSDGYTPAELESAIQDVIIENFAKLSEEGVQVKSKDELISVQDLKEKIKQITPISRVYEEKIKEIESWGKNFAINADEDETAAEAKPIRPTRQRRRQIK